MSMKYEINGHSFVHRIKPDSVDSTASPVFLHERRRSGNNRRGFFKTLRNTFTSCSSFSERNVVSENKVVEVSHPIESVKYNWSERVMADSIQERNLRLTSCHIPNLEPIINYLNVVRKHQGNSHNEIDAAKKELPLSTKEMLDFNYSQVVAKHSIAAFEEAIVIHEVLMFEGIHAIPSYHPELDSVAQSPRSEGYTASEELPIKPISTSSSRINGIQLLQMIKGDDVKAAYHLLEPICREQSGTPTFDDDVTYITEQLNIPEYDIRYLVALILQNGRQNDFSCRRYQKHLPPFENLLKKPRRPLLTPKKSSKTEPISPQWADIIPSPRGTRCNICYDDIATTFETTCCHLYLCLDCVSNNIEENNKADLESWINRHQMIECLQCESPIKLGVHEQELSEAAQRILSYFHQQYIIGLYSVHSNGIPVFCNDDNCGETYTLNNDQLYFQCDNIERHADQRIRLYHSLCKALWTHDHDCPQTLERRIQDEIKNINHMITYIDYIKPCTGSKKKNCQAFIEKIDGCHYIKCSKCHTSFFWCCEENRVSHNSLLRHGTHASVRISKRCKRLEQLKSTLNTLQKNTIDSHEKKNEDSVHEHEEKLLTLAQPGSDTLIKKALDKTKYDTKNNFYSNLHWSTMFWY